MRREDDLQLDNTAYGWLPSLSFASPTAMLMNINDHVCGILYFCSFEKTAKKPNSMVFWRDFCVYHFAIISIYIIMGFWYIDKTFETSINMGVSSVFSGRATYQN